jgi:predicted amidohydrolase YtcJ
VVVVQNPSHFTDPPELVRARFGESRGAGYQPFGSLAAAGIPLAIGSDGPMNPFLNLHFAVTHPVTPGEALSRERAVAAYTRGSAYAEHREHEKGTLAPGMLADLAVLSLDIFTVPADRLPAATSLLTIVGGAVVHDELTPAARGGRQACGGGAGIARCALRRDGGGSLPYENLP